MTKFLFLFLAFISTASFARTCYVDLVDEYSNYRYDTFTEYYSGCRDALRSCNRAKRDRGLFSADCRIRGGSTPGHGRGGSYNRFTHLLRMTDLQISKLAQNGGVGSCTVERSWFSTCNYYVKVNRRGFPHQTGCASSRVVNHRKCNHFDDERNAGCFIRQAIVQGKCK